MSWRGFSRTKRGEADSDLDASVQTKHPHCSLPKHRQSFQEKIKPLARTVSPFSLSQAAGCGFLGSGKFTESLKQPGKQDRCALPLLCGHSAAIIDILMFRSKPAICERSVVIRLSSCVFSPLKHSAVVLVLLQGQREKWKMENSYCSSGFFPGVKTVAIPAHISVMDALNLQVVVRTY